MQNIFKKPYFKLVLILLLIVLVFFAVQKSSNNKDEIINENNSVDSVDSNYKWKVVSNNDRIKDYKYNFDLALNVDNMTMDGILDFTYYNNNDVSMDELVFYLYANSYAKEEYHAIEEEHFDLGYPNGFSSGSIEIKSVDIEGGGSYEVTGNQDHLLEVNLNNKVNPSKSTNVRIEYTVTIPNSYGRFGYGNETISIVNCNPIMAVYDEDKGYYDYEYNSIGDPFFSECADYTANITVPKKYLVAPTGTILDKIYSDEMVTYVIDGENRRDFGFVTSDKFNVLSKDINGVRVNSYSFTSQKVNEKALEIAVDSIDVFSSKFGEYPYKTFNVVESNFFIGGMEYPGMVMIDDSYYTPIHGRIMEMIIVHEVAHQWWYGQVGNDQIAEPWLDEALATFSERVYYEHVYPDEYKDLIFNHVDSDFLGYNKRLEKDDTRIDMNTLEYDDEYSLVVYGFGGWMIDDLRDEIGEEAFYKALNLYLENNLFQIATREDLERAIEDVTGEDITSWFDENLQVQVGY